MVIDIKDDIVEINSAKVSAGNRLADTIEKAKCRIRSLFGCGTFSEDEKSPCSNEANGLGCKCLNKDYLVERMRCVISGRS